MKSQQNFEFHFVRSHLTLQQSPRRSNCVLAFDSLRHHKVRSSLDHWVHQLTNFAVVSMQNCCCFVMATRFDPNCLNVDKRKDQTFDFLVDLVSKYFHSIRRNCSSIFYKMKNVEIHNRKLAIFCIYSQFYCRHIFWLWNCDHRHFRLIVFCILWTRISFDHWRRARFVD